MRHQWLILFIVALALLSCRKATPAADAQAPPGTPSQGRSDAAMPGDGTDVSRATPDQRSAQPQPDVVSSARTRDIDALLDAATTRQTCNIVMGCPSGEALVAMGDEAIGPIVARYETLSRPNYQKVHLIDLLGRIGSTQALPFLRDRLKDTHWEVRTRSAFALGLIGARSERGRLKEALRETEGRSDHAFRYALAFAVAKLGDPDTGQILLEGLEPSSINTRNWGYTRVAVDAVAALNLDEACPKLRVAIGHNDTFLKRAAIAAAGQLNCPQGPVRRAVAAQLDSRIPSVRRRAVSTLKTLTGITFQSVEQWQKYDQR